MVVKKMHLGSDVLDAVMESRLKFINISTEVFQRVLRTEEYCSVRAVKAMETDNFGYIALEDGRILRC